MRRRRAGGTGRCSFEVTGTTRAPVDEVWRLLGEARRWRDWSFVTRADLLREGTPAPDGVGALRRFTVLGIGSREEVVAWDPPVHLGYVLRSGFPVRNYRSDVYLAADGTGTAVRWRSTFDPLVPGTGAMTRLALRTMIGRFAHALCRYAEEAGRR